MTLYTVPLLAVVVVIVAASSLRRTGRWTREMARAVVGIVITLAVAAIAIHWWSAAR